MEQEPTINDVEQALLSKVNRLLKQAEGKKATSPEEAASYAARAALLITKYNIDENKLRQAANDGKSGNPTIILRIENLLTTQRWHKILMTGIVHSNYCRYAFTYGATNIDIWGESHNIDACMALYRYLATEIDRICEVCYTQQCKRFQPTHPRQWKFNFRHGAAAVIHDRLIQQYRAMQEGKLITGPADHNAIARLVEKDVREQYGITRPEELTSDILLEIQRMVVEAVAASTAPAANDVKALVIVQDAALIEAEKRFIPNAKATRPEYFGHKHLQDRPGFKEGVRAGRTIALNNNKQLKEGKV